MRKIFVLLLVVYSVLGFAQSNSTPFLNFSKPPHGSSNWDQPLNTNFDLLDQFLSGQKSLPQSFWDKFLQGLQVNYVTQVTNKPSFFAADWNSTIVNKPSSFLPSLSNRSTVGGVFIPSGCGAGAHVNDINQSNGQLICTPDTNSSFSLLVNGSVITTGITALNFTCSSGLACAGSFNATTGVLTLTVTGSTATQAQSVAFSPLPGAYSSTQSVALSCASPSPTIFYTTDGTTPTHSGGTPTGTTAIFSSNISAGNTTIKAICTSSGLADSNMVSGVYSLQAPSASLSPSSNNFGTFKVGTSSNAQQFTFTNTGNGSMTISSITLTGSNPGDFAQSNTCGGTLGAGALCTINVTFTPTTTGSRTATLSIADNATGSPHTASLSGTGARPTDTPSPTSLTFSSQVINTTSAGQTVTLTNSGSVSSTISSVSITGANANQFAQTNNCSVVPGGGGTCTVSVTFTPTAAGVSTATLNFTDDAANSPQTVSLTGTGVNPAAPVVNFNNNSLSFSAQKVGTTSTGQSTTLSNTGNATLNISSLGITGANSSEFGQSNNCGSSVSAGGNCQITVTFTPNASGSRSAAITVTDNASGSPHSVSLTGIGSVPTETLAPTTLSFGTVAVGSTGNAQGVTITNTSAVPINISSIVITGDFTQTNNCGSTLAATSSCSVNVNFAPVTTGVRTGSLTVNDDSSGAPHSVSLSGTGAIPTATLSTTSVLMGDCFEASQNITLSNNGTVALSITSITMQQTDGTSGVLSVSNNCGTSLPAGNACTITATGTAVLSSGGTNHGTITIRDNASDSPQTIAVQFTIPPNKICNP